MEEQVLFILTMHRIKSTKINNYFISLYKNEFLIKFKKRKTTAQVIQCLINSSQNALLNIKQLKTFQFTKMMQRDLQL